MFLGLLPHWGFDIKSCPKVGNLTEVHDVSWSNPLLSLPIPVQEVVGLTADRCISLNF